jgi:hypothetical protein
MKETASRHARQAVKTISQRARYNEDNKSTKQLNEQIPQWTLRLGEYRC